MTTRTWWNAAALLGAALLATGCRGDAAAGRATAQDSSAPRDDYGVVVPDAHDRPARRIVSLNPSTTEMLFAIGAGARVVGRTMYDLWPAAARAVPDVGPGLRPNVEAVLSRHPDLVVLYASADNRPAATRLTRAGVAVLSLKNDRVADFARTAMLLGRATGDSAAAARLVDTVTHTLDSVRTATAALPHPTIFWHVWDSPLLTVGRGSFLSEVVAIAGGRNIYDDLPSASPPVALEDVIRRDPDYILAGADGARTIAASRGWQGVGAVRRGHVLIVDTALVGRPSVRLGEAARSLAVLLHPTETH